MLIVTINNIIGGPGGPKMRKIKTFLTAFAVTGLVLFGGGAVFAASTSDFSQTINAGNLATDIKDGSRDTVASPAVTMSAVGFSFDCQSGGSASTGTFGTSSERIYVTNGDAADSGWTLTLAATGGATDAWANGTPTDTIDFNDAGASGCTDDGTTGDTDGLAGQMTIDPSVSTLTTDCGSCTTTSVSKGSSDAFDEGTTDDITLLNAAAGSDDIWRGYLTDVDVEQTIPAETPADTYTINLTLTATAS
jgi:hypothetical protein